MLAIARSSLRDLALIGIACFIICTGETLASDEREWVIAYDSSYYDSAIDQILLRGFVGRVEPNGDTSREYTFDAFPLVKDCDRGLACFFCGDQDSRFLVNINPGAGRIADTLLACGDALAQLVSPTSSYDVNVPAGLLALNPDHFGPYFDRTTLVLRMNGSCEWDTVAVLDSAQTPTFLDDGATIVVFKWVEVDWHDDPVYIIAMYDIAGDSLFEPFPRDKWRMNLVATTRSEPMYFFAYEDPMGIYRAQVGQTGEELLYNYESRPHLWHLGWGIIDDSLIVKLGLKSDTGYAVIREALNLESLALSADTTFLGAERPSWDPPPQYGLYYDGSDCYRLSLDRNGSSDTLAIFSRSKLLTERNLQHLKLIDCADDSCRFILISDTAVVFCDTIWSCGPEVWEWLSDAALVAKEDTVLLVTRDPDQFWERYDPTDEQIQLLRLTPDCTLDTVGVFETSMKPSLSTDGMQLLATKMTARAHGGGEVPNILVYDIETGDFDFPLVADHPRWHPRRLGADDWLYFLKNDGVTNVWRYFPGVGEEKVTEAAVGDSVTHFYLTSTELSFRCLNASQQYHDPRSTRIGIKRVLINSDD